jgi:flagellin
MRIQHNIMAMNAYRNYNNNNSSLSSNLEKLSSGYKINRAGDDAAGLAISEKMRAQISGLDQAQSNVKDGISLVKTGEGALQEVQDMLNRMVTLATQSSNGTYDNDVDRANLQKEVTALKDEINRIADSSNFNGISLLDGSLDASANLTTSGNMAVGSELPSVGSVLGTDTVLHNTASTGGTTFSVDLHDVGFKNQTGDSLDIKVGDTTISLAGAPTNNNKGDALTAAQIVGKITAGTNTTGITMDNGKAKATINGQTFTVTGSGSTLTFTQDATPTTTSEEVDGSMKVSVTGGIKEGSAENVDAVKAVYTMSVASDGNFVDGNTIVIGANTYTLGSTATGGTTLNTAEANDSEKLASFLASKLTDTNYDITVDGSNLVFTAKNGGKVDAANGTGGTNPPQAAPTVTAPTIAAGNNAGGTANAGNGAITLGTATESVAGAAATVKGNTLVDYNVSTTNITNVTAGGTSRLASTSFKLTKDMVEDGATVTIGDKTYTFTTDSKNISKTGYVDATSGDLDTIAKNLTKAAAGNSVYTVGHDGSRITLTETVAHGANYDATGKYTGTDGFDLSTADGISKSLAYKGAANVGKALTLQIGDTADSYNQMSVNIEDIHTSNLGIDDVDISTQDGATAAIDKIKDAINQVSSTRGTLGAIQNRLEHTQNNLSVMSENITDAESTIRDTDMADEMMSYTKNNILVQAAQAMLAQANSVPQGVLQLLG